MAPVFGNRAVHGGRRWVWVGAVVLLGLAGALGAYRAQASSTAGALFLRKNVNAGSSDQTNSISVGVDPAGGMHAGFVNYSTDNSGNYHAYYEFCAAGADCANAANWSLVNLLTWAGTKRSTTQQ